MHTGICTHSISALCSSSPWLSLTLSWPQSLFPSHPPLGVCPLWLVYCYSQLQGVLQWPPCAEHLLCVRYWGIDSLVESFWNIPEVKYGFVGCFPNVKTETQKEVWSSGHTRTRASGLTLNLSLLFLHLEPCPFSCWTHHLLSPRSDTSKL